MEQESLTRPRAQSPREDSGLRHGKGGRTERGQLHVGQTVENETVVGMMVVAL